MQRTLWISLKNNLSLTHGKSPDEGKRSYQQDRKEGQHNIGVTTWETRHMYKHMCPLLKLQLIYYTQSHDRLSGLVNWCIVGACVAV